MKQCPQCGVHNDDETSFCGNCGYQFPQSAVCPQCGAPLENGAVFCPNCGYNVQSAFSPNSGDVFAEGNVPGTAIPANDSYGQNPEYLSGPPMQEEPSSANNSKLLSILIGLLALAGVCAAGFWFFENYTSSNSLFEVDYMPFQESEDGLWGMIGKDGKVLFSNEFKNRPTVAKHGRFWVKNNDGLWELYTAEKKPKRIGEQYDQAGVFIEDVAPVVAHNQPITFIDKNGDVKFTLTKAGDKPITKCTNFMGGLAIFVAGDKMGCINTKGDIVIQPDYDDVGLAGDGQYLFAAKKDGDEITVYILSTKGEVMSSFPKDKFEDITPVFISGLAVAKQKTPNDNRRAGLIDKNGEWVVKPNANFHDITQIYNGYFIFSDGRNYGMANKKGEIIIRPKYKQLKFTQKNKLLFAKDDYKDSEWKLITYSEETVSYEKYHNVEHFIGSLAPVEISENNWGFINSKGEVQPIDPFIYKLDVDEFGEEVFESQYLDVEYFTNQLSISQDGFLGLSLNQNANEIFTQLRSLTSQSMGMEPKNHSYSTQINETISLEESQGEFTATFDGRYVNEKDIWATDDWGYEYVKSTEYNYNDKKPKRLELKIRRSGLLKGRMSALTAQVISKVKSLGDLQKENSNAAVVKAGNNTWIVAYTGSELIISCGNININSFDIEKYKDVDEDSDVDFSVTSTESTDDDGIDFADSTSYPAAETAGHDEPIYKSVEQIPTFPGGEAALMKYLSSHIQYPAMAAENNVQGRVVLQFVVEKDGHVGEVKVVRSVDKDLDREAVRVCKTLPKFTPGCQNGQPVRVWYTLPVSFKLQGTNAGEE